MKRSLVLVFLLSKGSFLYGNEPSFQSAECRHQERIEDFEGFDEFDEAVESAIDMGILRNKPEMRQPSSVEVVARRMVGYLFMKYLALKGLMNSGYVSCKVVLHHIWSALISSLTRKESHGN